MDCLFKTTFEGRFGVIKCSSVPFKFRGILFSFDGKWCKRVFLLLIFIVVVVEVIGVAIPETIKYCMADRFKCSTWYNRFIHLCVKKHPRVLISFNIAVQVQAMWKLWKESFLSFCMVEFFVLCIVNVMTIKLILCTIVTKEINQTGKIDQTRIIITLNTCWSQICCFSFSHFHKTLFRSSTLYFLTFHKINLQLYLQEQQTTTTSIVCFTFPYSFALNLQFYLVNLDYYRNLWGKN